MKHKQDKHPVMKIRRLLCRLQHGFRSIPKRLQAKPLAARRLTMQNFTGIAKFTPEQSIAFFAEQLEDEPVFVMKEILSAIKEDEKLSSLQVLDKFGRQFAKRISLTVNSNDWNAWVSKLFHAKKVLEDKLMNGDKQKA